ncbi:hypothetical protein BT69DRAFT_1351933 [Atractiella rhizophila]|nr:hypothetical protein BT69DRAFT_1351933 [Atractiella rhizophila]
MASELPIFPAEVWVLVAEQLPLSSLNMFNRVCKAIRTLTTSTLYRTIPGSLDYKKSRAAVSSLLERPELLKHVKHLALHGARMEEDDSIHKLSIKLLKNAVLQENLESFEFVYTEETHGGWWHSEDLLKDNIIWEAIEEGNFPRLEHLTVRECPYGSDEHRPSLYDLTFWKKIQFSTHAYMFDDLDESPYTSDMFTWLAANESLTFLDLELRFDDGAATKDCTSIVDLLTSANWPALVDLSFSGAYCDDADMVEEEFGYGPSSSVRDFLLKHPQLRRLKITSCPQCDFQGPQTVPLAGIPSGALPNLEYFAGIRDGVEDLAKAGLANLKEVVLVDDFSGMGWQDEQHPPPGETFANAISSLAKLEVLEVDLSYEDYDSEDEPEDARAICHRIAQASSSLKKLILRGVSDKETIENVINAFRGHASLEILEFKGSFIPYSGDARDAVDTLMSDIKKVLGEGSGHLQTVILRQENRYSWIIIPADFFIVTV